MKLFALFCLVGFAAASGEWEWEVGKEYEFEYKGRQISGMPQLESQFSGLGIKAKVLINVKDPERLVLRVVEPEYVTVNDVLKPKTQEEMKKEYPYADDKSNDWRYLALPPKQPVPGELQKYLALPVEFVMDYDGKVEKLVLSREEPLWSINFKKALISLFQARFIAAEYELQQNRMEKPPLEENINIWKSEEQSPDGQCLVEYTMHPVLKSKVVENPDMIPYPEVCAEEKYFEIIKTRDVDNCNNRAVFSYYKPGRFSCQGELGANCPYTWTRSSSTKYIACLSRSRSERFLEKLVIQSIVNEAELSQNILGIEAERTMTGVRQVLLLKKVKETGSNIPIIPIPVTISNLMYEFSKEKMYNGERYITESRVPREFPIEESVVSNTIPKTFLTGAHMRGFHGLSEEIKPQILEMIKEVSAQLKNADDKKLSEALINMKLLGVSRGITMMNTTRQIKEIYSEMTGPTEKNLFIDSVTMSGTPIAVEFMVDLVMDGQLTDLQIGKFFMWLPQHVMLPTEGTIEMLMNVLESPKIKSNKVVYNTVIGGLSKLIQYACLSENHRVSYPTWVFGEFCNPESQVVLRRWLPFLSEKLQTVSSPEEKNVYILALGTVTHTATIPQLIPIVDGHYGASTLNRILAIYSLVSAGSTNRPLVISTLRTIFVNPAEKTEIRIVALNGILKMYPSNEILQMIAATTQQEVQMEPELLKTINIAFYSLGHIKTSSKMEEKTISLIERVRAAYHLIKKVPGMVPSSGILYGSQYLEEIGVGYEAFVNYIASQTSILPKQMYTEVIYQLNNLRISPLKFGLRFKEGETFYQKVGKILAAENGVPQEVLEERLDMAISPEIKEIYEKLRIKPQVSRHEGKNDDGAFYLSIFDSGIMFFDWEDLTKTMIKKHLMPILRMPKESLLNLGETPLEMQSTVDLAPISTLIPSDMGLPIYVEVHAPMTVSFSGKILSSIMSLVHSFNIYGKFVYTSQVSGWVGTVCPFTNEYLVTAIDQHAVINLPGQLEMKIDLPEQKLKLGLSLTPKTEMPVEIMQFHTVPYTVRDKIMNLRPMVKSQNLKIIKTKPVPVEKSLEFGEYLGLHIKTSTKTESAFTDLETVAELLRIYKCPMNMLLFGWTLPALTETTKVSLRRHSYNVLYYPSLSPTKEIVMELKVGYASKMHHLNSEPHYHKLKPLSWGRPGYYERESEEEEFLVNENHKGVNIIKKYIPFRLVSSPFGEVHPIRQEKMKELFAELEGESQGIVLVSNVILKGSRPKTLTYSLALGSSSTGRQSSGLFVKEKWNLILDNPQAQEIKKFCIKGSLDLPVMSLSSNVESQSETKFSFKNVIGMGSGSCDESSIVSTGYTKVTEMQRRYSKMSYESLECQNLVREGRPAALYLPICQLASLQPKTLDEIVLTNEFKNVPTYSEYIEQSLMNYLKSYLWVYLREETLKETSVDYLYRGVEQGRLNYVTETKVQFSPYSPSYNLTITTPKEYMKFANVHLRYPYHLFFPLKAGVNNLASGISRLRGNSFLNEQPVCAVFDDSIKTFDNKTIPFSLNKCSHLISSDCHDHGTFAVSYKRDPAFNNRKRVLVHLRTLKVQMIVGPVEVHVNDRPVHISVGSHYPLRDVHGGLFGIVSRPNEDTLELRAEKYRVELLRMDQEKLILGMDKSMTNSLCGICGDYNGKLLGDIAGPQRCLYSSPELAIASYRIGRDCEPLPEAVKEMLRSENERCVKLEQYEEYGEQDSEEEEREDVEEEEEEGEEAVMLPQRYVQSSSRPTSEECTVMKHIIVHRSGEVCISQLPIVQCVQGCKVHGQRYVDKEIPFVCLPQGRLANHYLSKVREGRRLPELKPMRPNFFTGISQPTYCVPTHHSGPF